MDGIDTFGGLNGVRLRASYSWELENIAMMR